MSEVRYNASSHVGRVRKTNEDSIIALPEHGIWAVSDGMGGHTAGDFASQTVTEAMMLLPDDLDPGARMHALRDAIHRAHVTVRGEAEERGGATIGATVVALLISDHHFVTFWAGDSRLYRLRDGKITLLTHDHSVVGELVQAGQLTWDEAELHPQSNAITRAVGVGDVLEVDKVRGDADSGDRFLLCSDGLTKYADFSTLEHVLKEEPIETVTDRLVTLALDAGGADNISVIVVDIG